MKKLTLLLLFALLLSHSTFAQKKKKRKKQVVLIETEFGDIQVRLFNETPNHKENFLKLVEEGTYDSTLFHRVISEFMIQGGDPDSKKAEKGVALGNGELGYTIPPEFVDSLFHKKGALAAARMGDDVNPDKESSSCQFYIVQGRKFSESDLKLLEKKMNVQLKNALYQKFFDDEKNEAFRQRLMNSQQTKNQQAYQELLNEIEPGINEEYEKQKFSFSEAQIKAYSTIGGAPHLDGGYTVFGEVIEGLDVVDVIAMQATDQRNRPIKDIRVKMKLVKR